MAYDEFIALDRGLLRHRLKAISRRCRKATPGADASAIHGRLGARAALLQSPILPVVSLSYYKNRNFQTNPVDKPHTRISRFLPVFGRRPHFSALNFSDSFC